MKRVLAAVLMMTGTLAYAEDNVMLKHAKQNGVERCLPAVERISNFIADGPHGANSTWNSDWPDKSAFNSVIERTYTDGVMLSSVTVANVESGQCYTEYEKIFYMEGSCLGAAASFEGAKYNGELNEKVHYLDHNDVDLYLMPAGSGCIVVRREILMNLE